MKKYNLLRVIAVTLVLLFTFNLIPATALAVGDDIYVDIDYEAIINQIADESDLNSKNPEDKKIITEDLGKRSANEKHFKLEDGSYVVAQYPDIVHYENEDGEWIDIDNTLIFEKAENENDFDGYTNKDNSFDVKLSKNGRDQLLRINEDDYHISMKLVEDDIKKSIIEIDKLENIIPIEDDTAIEEKNNQIKQLDNLESKAEYIDILPGIDIEYVVQAHGVKEYIVVNEHKDSYVFTFELDLGNLVPYMNSDGSISIRTVSGEEKYIIPAPYMYDSNNNYSEDVTYSVILSDNGKYKFTVTADEDWINSTSTLFPVKIDPTIIKSTPISQSVTDTFVSSSNSNLSTVFSSEKYLFVGNDNRSSVADNYKTTRAYIKWNIPTIPSSSCVITSAKLKLYQLDFERTTNPIIEVRQIVNSWNSETHWNTSIKYDDTILDCVTIGDPDEMPVVELDVTKAVRNSLVDTNHNYGVVIKAQDENESGTSCVKFASSEYDIELNRPTIEMYYHEQKGLDSEYSFLPIDCGDVGTAYINLYSGDVSFIYDTYVSPTNNTEVKHIYNQYMSNVSAYNEDNYEYYSYIYDDIYVGDFWKMSSQEVIVPISRSEFEGDYVNYISDSNAMVSEDNIYGIGYAYAYNDQYGNNVLLQKIGTNQYADKDDKGYSLTVIMDGTTVSGYTLTTPDGYTKVFNNIVQIAVGEDENSRSKGYITQSTSPGGNIHSYSYLGGGFYPSQLEDVQYGSERKSTGFGYDDDGFLSSICYGSSVISSFDYVTSSSGHKLLTKIVNSNGTTLLAYNSSDLLYSIIDDNGNNLTFKYSDRNGRVSSVEWTPVGEDTEIIDFDFDLGVTTVHYSGWDTALASEDNEATVVDSIYLKFGFDLNGYNTYVYAHNSGQEIFELVNDEYKGLEHIAINDPAADYEDFTGDQLISMYNSFDLDSNSSSLRSTSLSKLSLSNEQSYSGSTSYKFEINEATRATKSMTKEVSLTEGSHTFSAYVYCPNGLTPIETYQNAYIQLSADAVDYNYAEATSNTIECTVGNNESTGWQKLTVDFTFDGNPSTFELSIDSVNGYGTMYVDKIMIDGIVVTWPVQSARFATGFDYYDDLDWETSSTYSQQYVSNDALYYVVETDEEGNEVYYWSLPDDVTLEQTNENILFGDYSLKIDGDINKENSIYHTYYLNNSMPEDGFVLSGWGKADSLPTNDPSTRGFELFAYYVYRVTTADGEYEERTVSTAIPFNWQNDEWQFVSAKLDMPELADGETLIYMYSVTFGALYKGNVGNAYFDNIELAEAS